MGRSRGGLTTKIHALVDGGLRPVAVLSPGQAGDNPRLVPLLDTLVEAGHRPAHLLGDKAYSHPSTRRELRRRRLGHTIPERRDQLDRRQAKGSAGGRPPKFDAELYRQATPSSAASADSSNGVATRYEKYAHTYLGGVLLAAIIIHTRLG